VIAAAAVADYKPQVVFDHKLKKNEHEFDLKLVKTIDILSDLGKNKKNQLLVGFALETQNEVENAIQKLIKKNLDLIVLNSLNDIGAGFGGEQNKVTLIDKNRTQFSFELKTKQEVATDIFNFVIKMMNDKNYEF
jgi:phosphopantothenoylcysteine decarboxylase/phosphopantothenate--cysteine ligase